VQEAVEDIHIENNPRSVEENIDIEPAIESLKNSSMEIADKQIDDNLKELRDLEVELKGTNRLTVADRMDRAEDEMSGQNSSTGQGVNQDVITGGQDALTGGEDVLTGRVGLGQDGARVQGLESGRHETSFNCPFAGLRVNDDYDLSKVNCSKLKTP
jgi:hypothetical protein